MAGGVGVGAGHQAHVPAHYGEPVEAEKKEAPKESHAEDHKKEKSVLQAKLTKLAIQIGYAGIKSSYASLEYVARNLLCSSNRDGVIPALVNDGRVRLPTH